MEPTETEATTQIIEEQPVPRRRKKSVWVFVCLGTGVVLSALLVLLTVLRNSHPQVQSLTADDTEQLKYDAQQQANDQSKADRIRNGSLLLRKEDADTQAQLNSLMGQLQGDSGTKVPVPMSDDQQVRTEEEAISQVLRDQKPAGPAPAYEPRPGGPPSSPAQTTTELSDRPMFVYSRTFGGAKYVDIPKNLRESQSMSSTAEPKPAKASADIGALPTAPVQKTSASGSLEGTQVSRDEKTAVIYTEHAPVTLFEGEMIESVLLNRIIADTEPSPVICQISRDVFDNTGRYVVLPANSRIVGLSQVVNYKGAHRLFISFHRIILPNGPSIDFPPSKKALKALDSTGALGVVSKVERHWFLQFGTAIFFGVLDGIAGAAQRSQDLYSTRSIVLGRTSENFQRILDNIMSQYSTIVPTIRVDQGKRLKIYLSDDVLISPYARLTDRSYYANR